MAYALHFDKPFILLITPVGPPEVANFSLGEKIAEKIVTSEAYPQAWWPSSRCHLRQIAALQFDSPGVGSFVTPRLQASCVSSSSIALSRVVGVVRGCRSIQELSDTVFNILVY